MDLILTEVKERWRLNVETKRNRIEILGLSLKVFLKEIDQWNDIQNMEINPAVRKVSPLSFRKG